MKKLLFSILLIASVVFCSEVSIADMYYKNKMFPPDAVIKHSYNKMMETLGWKFVDSIGKYEDERGKYIYYYVKLESREKRYNELNLPIRLIHLDTDYWIMELPTFNSTYRSLLIKEDNK